MEWNGSYWLSRLAFFWWYWFPTGDTTARLRGVERKLNALLRHHGVDPTQGLPLSDRVKQLAADPGRKIEAIKVYCEETGAGLAEAKEAIESFTNSK